jgi:ribosome-binding protein aMBF1 (putative translation factor)
LGDTVRRARCAKGWSIEQLSKRSGVPGRLIGELVEANPFVLCASLILDRG